MRKKKLLIIIVENVNRELPSKVILSLKALKENFRVVIGFKGIVWTLCKYLNPGIIFLKSFGDKNTNFIDEVKKNDFKLISNDEELFLTYDHQERIIWRMKNENINKIDRIISVGDTDDLILRKIFPEINSRIIKCGNIRVETLKNPYVDIFLEQGKKIKKVYGKFNLALTSFGRINSAMTEKYTIDYVFSRIVNENLDPESSAANTENRYIIAQRDALLTFIKFIENFEKNFPNEKLVISVKPGENIEFWKYYFSKRKFKNIFLRTDYNLLTNYYIAAAENVISTNSTVLMEAYILGKKTINILGQKPQVSDIDFLKKSSYVVRNYEELKTTFDDIILNKKKFLKVNDELNKSIFNTKNDYDIFKNLLSEMNTVLSVSHSSIYKSNKIKIYIIYLNLFREFKKIIKRFLLKLFKRKKLSLMQKLHIMKVGEKLDYKNFLSVVNKYNRFEKLNNLRIKQIIPQVFLLDIDE